MWCWKYNTIIIVIWCIRRSPAAQCLYRYKGYTFNQTTHEDLPAIPVAELNLSNPAEPELEVNLMNRTGDFNLTVFLNPSVDNESDCPTTLNETQDLRQYHRTCPVYKDIDQNLIQIFNNISTGCYYFVMTNPNGDNWEMGPAFLETNYSYQDTKLKITKHKFKPLDNLSRDLKIQVIVPLSCIKVNVELYQIDGDVDAKDEIEQYRITGSQDCWISRDGMEVKFHCDRSPLITKLGLEVRLVNVTGEKWTIVITWKKLQATGGTYYIQFLSQTRLCEAERGYGTINNWIPIKINNLILLDYQQPLPPLVSPEPNNVRHILFISLSVCILLGITVITICLCRRKRVPKIDEGGQRSMERPCQWQLNQALLNERESNHILLVYARDSQPFMTLMNEFRVGLAKECDCRVFDLYSERDWRSICNYGGAQWIEQRLEDGCRIIWVDTPQFRLQLSNQENQYAVGDFRDQVIPYAVRLATGSYQNAATQYKRHFVVRMKGFEVEYELDDPLVGVVPHTRFFIPTHISDLYQELKDCLQVPVAPAEE